MLFWTPLRALCLTSLLLSWALSPVLGVPVPIHPINSQTKFASSIDNKHQEKLHQYHQNPPNQQAHPGKVTLHNVPGQGNHGPVANGHIIGTVAVDPAHQHQRMTSEDLHAHVAHAKADSRLAGYEIHAHHTPGNAHVIFHATPTIHHAMPGNVERDGRQHAVLHPGHNPLDTHAALPQNAQLRIHNELRAKREQNPSEFTRYHQHSTGAEKGPDQYVVGKIPISNSGLHHQMTPGALEAHAKYIHDRFAPPEHKDQVHVHVTHKPGDNYVDYHIVPTLKVATQKDIHAHLDHQGPQHYAVRPITQDRNAVAKKEAEIGRRLKPEEVPFVDHKLTYHGTMPAHSTGPMTPPQLHAYAKYAKSELIRQHGLQSVNADDMVVAASHKDGDTEVHYHTQPKHDLQVRRGNGEDLLSRHFNHALRMAGHLDGNGKPWHHAELGALHDSLTAKRTTSATFDEDISGHVIGVSGSGDKPCARCAQTLDNLGGITYRRH